MTACSLCQVLCQESWRRQQEAVGRKGQSRAGRCGAVLRESDVVTGMLVACISQSVLGMMLHAFTVFNLACIPSDGTCLEKGDMRWEAVLCSEFTTYRNSSWFHGGR